MYELKRKIGYSSLGMSGKMRLSAVVDYMQDSSDFHLKSIAALQKYFQENNVGMYVVSRQLDFIRLPEIGEDLTLNTYTHELKSMYGYRNTLIYGNSGDLCVKANSVGAFMDLHTSRPVKAPEEVVAQVPMLPKFDMEYLPRKVKIPDISFENAGELTVRKFHLDANRHVNNAKFIDIAEEFLPEGFGERDIRRLMIEYRTPASLGDVIRAERYLMNDKIIIKLGGDNVTYAVVEFTY